MKEGRKETSGKRKERKKERCNRPQQESGGCVGQSQWAHYTPTQGWTGETLDVLNVWVTHRCVGALKQLFKRGHPVLNMEGGQWRWWTKAAAVNEYDDWKQAQRPPSAVTSERFNMKMSIMDIFGPQVKNKCWCHRESQKPLLLQTHWLRFLTATLDQLLTFPLGPHCSSCHTATEYLSTSKTFLFSCVFTAGVSKLSS